MDHVVLQHLKPSENESESHFALFVILKNKSVKAAMFWLGMVWYFDLFTIMILKLKIDMVC